MILHYINFSRWSIGVFPPLAQMTSVQQGRLACVLRCETTLACTNERRFEIGGAEVTLSLSLKQHPLNKVFN